MPNILNTFFLFVCAPEKILASRLLFSAPHMYYNQCFSACKTLQRLISSNGDHSICNIQICQVVFKKYDNDQRKLVLWCAGGNYEWDAPRENKCSHTHTHIHKIFQENADVHRINHNTSPPPPSSSIPPSISSTQNQCQLSLSLPPDCTSEGTLSLSCRGVKRKSWLLQAVSCSDVI